MGGEHEVCFHKDNNINCVCYYENPNENPIEFTFRDRFIWKKIIVEMCLFAHLHKIAVKRFFYKNNKAIDMEDFYLYWYNMCDEVKYNVLLEITYNLFKIFPGKLCTYFDRYWYDNLSEYDDTEAIIPHYGFKQSLKLELQRHNYQGPTFDLANCKWFNTDVIPFDIRVCLDRKIKLPKPLEVLLEIFPIDVVGLIGEYLYVICTKIQTNSEQN